VTHRHSDNGDALPSGPTRIPRPGWRAALTRAGQQFVRDNVTDRAAALTYFGVLAIFPGLLVLISILGLIGRSSAQSLLDNLRSVAPGGVASFLHTVITQVQGRATAAGVAAAVGVVIAMWSASGYVAAFGRAMNGIYNIQEGRPVTRLAPLRLAVTAALVVMLVASAVIVVVTGPVARTVGHLLGIGNAGVTIWEILKWPVLVILVILMFSLLYWATPNVRQPGLRWIAPGGLVAVLAWLVISALFGIYVSFSGSYNRTYGSLATVIVFLVWLWLSNTAILLGAEFNAEIQRQRMLEAGMPADVDPYLELRDTTKLDDAETTRVEQAARERQRTVG
jgi:membrane protein